MATESAFTDLTFKLPLSITASGTTQAIIAKLAGSYGLTEVVPNSKYNSPILSNNGSESGAVELLTLRGLCFSPKTESTGTDSFKTISFKVSLVFSRPATVPGGAGALVMHPSDANAAAVIGLDSVGELTPQRGIDLQGQYLASFGDWWYTTKRHNDTREFDYVYLDIDTYKYLASSDEFYTTPLTTEEQQSRGLFVTRASYTLPIQQAGQPRYQTFRTLNFAPWPTPTQNLDTFDSNDLAYYLGPTCPPWWRDTNMVATEAPSGGNGLVAPVEFSAKVVDPPPVEQKTCGTINRVELFSLLKANGYITENVKPLRTIPAFAIRILIWLALIGTAIFGISKALPKDF